MIYSENTRKARSSAAIYLRTARYQIKRVRRGGKKIGLVEAGWIFGLLDRELAILTGEGSYPAWVSADKVRNLRAKLIHQVRELCERDSLTVKGFTVPLTPISDETEWEASRRRRD